MVVSRRHQHLDAPLLRLPWPLPSTAGGRGGSPVSPPRHLLPTKMHLELGRRLFRPPNFTSGLCEVSNLPAAHWDFWTSSSFCVFCLFPYSFERDKEKNRDRNYRLVHSSNVARVGAGPRLKTCRYNLDLSQGWQEPDSLSHHCCLLVPTLWSWSQRPGGGVEPQPRRCGVLPSFG